MRIVVMGTGPFAVPSFRWLLSTSHTVPMLVTRPPHGRRKQPAGPMRSVAEEAGLPVIDPESVNSPEAQQKIHQCQADLFLVCDYGQILAQDTLRLAVRGGINLHGSLLPMYRGAAPVNWAVYHGDAETGVSVIHMTPGLDAGPVLATRSTAIGAEEIAPDLELRLSNLGVGAVEEAIELLEASAPDAKIGHIQDAALVSKAPRLKKSDGEVAWSRSASDISNQVRALKPWPGTYTHWHREVHEPLRIILAEVSLVPVELAGEVHCDAGEVVSADGDHLWIATGYGVLSVDRLQPAGKRAMAVGEWLRGHRVAVGSRFG